VVAQGEVAAALEIGFVGLIEEQTAEVEGSGEPLLLLLGAAGLLAVIAQSLGAIGQRPVVGSCSARRKPSGLRAGPGGGTSGESTGAIGCPSLTVQASTFP
jgi:hypothetical protein